jgi:hypothetical protein
MIPFPCRRNCCLDQQDICLGCGRLLSEITGWHQADDAQKQQIVVNAHARLGLIHQGQASQLSAGLLEPFTAKPSIQR